MNPDTDRYHQPSAPHIPELKVDAFACRSNNATSFPMSHHNIAHIRPGTDYRPIPAAHLLGSNAASCAGAALQIPIAS